MTGIMYSDFFDAPRTVEKPVGKSKKAKVMEPKGKKGKKGKGVTFDEEEDEKDVADDAREVMGRFKEDLFADDEEEEAENDQRMSSFLFLLE
jgi:U3 small nucleolar ribonucleoprotein component